jgi:flagellin
MSTINTNVQSMVAQRVLNQTNGKLNNTLEKLSTGLRINSGKDDPAGLIASENLRSEKKSLQAAIGNAERADQVMNIAEGGLKEANSLLLELQSLVTKSANDAGLSEAEKKANQQEVDQILSSLDRISSTTTFQGQKLLNGNFDFSVTDQSSAVESVNVTRANADGDEITAEAQVTGSAQRAGFFLSTGGNLDLSGSGNDAGDDIRFSIEVTGTKGTKEFSFTSGTTTAAMKKQINSFSEVLGVSATASAGGGGDGLRLDSTGFGSEEFVSVTVTEAGDINNGNTSLGLYNLSGSDTDVAGSKIDTFNNLVDTTKKDTGQDVSALVNGQSVESNGRELSINLANLEATVLLSEDTGSTLHAQKKGSNATLFKASGGAVFNIGPDVNINNQVSTGIQSVATNKLGDAATGFLDDLSSGGSANVVDGDLTKAQKIVNESISQVSELRGRIGAFQKNTLQPTINNLNVTLENTAAAESSIRDTDFAKTTADLTRQQILQQSATNTLSIANNAPQNVLSLLGGGG